MFIMPNHMHFLLNYTGEGSSLNILIGNGKRFLAYVILKTKRKAIDGAAQSFTAKFPT